jgi:hypothetical protein
VAHFFERICFDLADAFAGDFEAAADFFKGAGLFVRESEAKFQDQALAGRQLGDEDAELHL